MKNTGITCRDIVTIQTCSNTGRCQRVEVGSYRINLTRETAFQTFYEYATQIGDRDGPCLAARLQIL